MTFHPLLLPAAQVLLTNVVTAVGTLVTHATQLSAKAQAIQAAGGPAIPVNIAGAHLRLCAKQACSWQPRSSWAVLAKMCGPCGTLAAGRPGGQFVPPHPLPPPYHRHRRRPQQYQPEL